MLAALTEAPVQCQANALASTGSIATAQQHTAQQKQAQTAHTQLPAVPTWPTGLNTSKEQSDVMPLYNPFPRTPWIMA